MICSVIIFFTGYFSYPVLHGDFWFTHKYPPTLPQKTNKPSTALLVNNSKEQLHSVDRKLEPIAPAELALDDKAVNNADGAKKEIITKALSEKPEPLDENQQALMAWAAQHKNDVNDIIDAYFPASLRDLMKKNINDNNHFLNTPEIEQAPDDDDNWAFVMEQKIRYLINDHELSNNVELLSVTCKQLVCELMGIDRGGKSWRRVFFSMFDVLPIRQRREYRPKYASLLAESDRYIYSQIFFEHGLTSF